MSLLSSELPSLYGEVFDDQFDPWKALLRQLCGAGIPSMSISVGLKRSQCGTDGVGAR